MKRQSVLPGIFLPESSPKISSEPFLPSGEEAGFAPEEAWPPLSQMMGSLLVLELEEKKESLLPPIKVVGLGIKAGPLPKEYLKIVREAEVLAGGRRQLAAFKDHPAEKITFGANLEAALAAMEERRREGRNVVALADGDPLFFGIGTVLAKRFGEQDVKIFPGLSCMQEAAARLSVPWVGMSAVSLHGRRDMLGLTAAVLGGGAICVLTDDKSGPDFIAGYLLDRGVDWFTMHVFEKMGGPTEQYRRLSLPDAAGLEFATGNTVILLPTGKVRRAFLGILEKELAMEGGLVTKAPVRAVALGLMAVKPEDVVWDIGSGSGAVAIEASSLAARGLVCAVERVSSRVMCVEENRRRFGAVNVEIIVGSAPDCLGNLPDPDCIFVGGGLGGANGRELLDALLARLKPGGRLVAACVLQKSLHLALQTLKERGLDFELTSVQAAQSSPLADDIYLAALNQVFLLSVRVCF